MKIDINKNGFVSGEYIDIKTDVSNRKNRKICIRIAVY